MTRKFALAAMAVLLCAGLCLAATSISTYDKSPAKVSIKKIPVQSERTAYVAPIKRNPKAWHINESFEGSFPPAGWVVYDVADPSATWIQSSDAYHTGSYSARCYWSASGVPGEDWLVTPQFTVQANDTCYFWFRGIVTGWPPDDTYLMLSTTDNLPASFTVELLHIPENSYTQTFTQYAVDLSAYAGQQVYLAFRNVNTYGDGVYIDDVLIGCEYTPQPGDLALQSIDEPSEPFVEPGLPFQPAVTVRNPGTTPVSNFQVVYSISDRSKALVYEDTTDVAGPLDPGSTVPVTFAEFTPQPYTEYDITAYVSAAGDPYAANDTLHFFFRTWDLDVATTAILAPTGLIEPSNPVDPQATFHNNGQETATFDAYFEIYEGTTLIYGESVTITDLAAGADTTVTFPNWPAPHNSGTYTATAYTVMAHDLNNGNDTLSLPFTCSIMGWHALTPTAPVVVQWPGGCTDGEKLWSVGGLVASSSLTNVVQVYDPVANSWSQPTTLPVAVFRPACAIIGGKLYVIGGYDASFAAQPYTQIYDIASNTWSNGTPPPSARGGCGGGVIDGKMYIVGGAVSSSFPTDCPTWEYNPAADTTGGTPWTQLADCPRGANGLILGAPFWGAPGLNFIVVGGDYRGNDDYYIYNPSGGWTTLATGPADAGSKDPGLLWDNQHIYLFGGDPDGWWSYYSNKTYHYNLGTGSWEDLGVTLNQSYEGMIGAIIDQKIYSFSGTIGSGPITPTPFEWTYDLTYTGVTGDSPAKPVQDGSILLSNHPNPVRSRTTLSFSLPKAQDYMLKVYNIAGQQVATFAGKGRAGVNSVNWDAGKSGAGVYFYQLISGGMSATRKLVVIK